MPRRRKRLDPALFDLPVERIRSGYYADKYFDRLRDALRAGGRSGARALMQVASPTGGHLGGVDEALAILKAGVDDWGALDVSALYEGDRFDAWETVLTVEGPYEAFAHLETLYVGVLARRTRVCASVRLAVEAARSKPILFFGARHDHYAMQPGDGYSAFVAGAQAVSTEAHGAFWGSAKLVGGAPHATRRRVRRRHGARDPALRRRDGCRGRTSSRSSTTRTTRSRRASPSRAHSRGDSGACDSTRPRRWSTRRCSR